jgi:hypothetical protein
MKGIEAQKKINIEKFVTALRLALDVPSYGGSSDEARVWF